MNIGAKIRIYLLRRKIEKIEKKLRKGMLINEWELLEKKRNNFIKEIEMYKRD